MERRVCELLGLKRLSHSRFVARRTTSSKASSSRSLCNSFKDSAAEEGAAPTAAPDPPTAMALSCRERDRGRGSLLSLGPGRGAAGKKRGFTERRSVEGRRQAQQGSTLPATPPQHKDRLSSRRSGETQWESRAAKVKTAGECESPLCAEATDALLGGSRTLRRVALLKAAPSLPKEITDPRVGQETRWLLKTKEQRTPCLLPSSRLPLLVACGTQVARLLSRGASAPCAASLPSAHGGEGDSDTLPCRQLKPPKRRSDFLYLAAPSEDSCSSPRDPAAAPPLREWKSSPLRATRAPGLCSSASFLSRNSLQTGDCLRPFSGRLELVRLCTSWRGQPKSRRRRCRPRPRRRAAALLALVLLRRRPLSSLRVGMG